MNRDGVDIFWAGFFIGLIANVAELEGQVGELRDGCEQIAKHIANGDEDIAQYLAYDLIAETETKEDE